MPALNKENTGEFTLVPIKVLPLRLSPTDHSGLVGEDAGRCRLEHAARSAGRTVDVQDGQREELAAVGEKLSAERGRTASCESSLLPCPVESHVFVSLPRGVYKHKKRRPNKRLISFAVFVDLRGEDLGEALGELHSVHGEKAEGSHCRRESLSASPLLPSQTCCIKESNKHILASAVFTL